MDSRIRTVTSPWLAVLSSLTIVLAGCGGRTGGGPSAASNSSLATASASASTSATPTPVPSGRVATPTELAAMVQAGKAGAEQDLNLGDGATCTDHHDCLYFDHADGVIGIDAGIVHANEGCPDGCGGASCWIFQYQAAGSWHYVNARCAQSPGYTPGADSIVYVSGCANVRSNPGSNGKVVDCVKDGTHVNVDSAPLYTDGKIWWHIEGKGWMAHDFLVAPKSAG